MVRLHVALTLLVLLTVEAAAHNPFRRRHNTRYSPRRRPSVGGATVYWRGGVRRRPAAVRVNDGDGNVGHGTPIDVDNVGGVGIVGQENPADAANVGGVGIVGQENPDDAANVGGVGIVGQENPDDAANVGGVGIVGQENPDDAANPRQTVGVLR
ncbi:hypothetical protein Hamer_G012352 [Homarus americanus]|uniref:Uncharacterized protein n=1 Tax=Homarus americanus TaxID=6706 RepID=A0A8J5K5Z4_HOMAM|nr:hypothetical protein Hamer_G012352 [Homarus americanus]